MKLVCTALMAALLGAPAGWAAEKASAVSAERVTTGIVQSVSTADPAKGTKSEIILAGPSGKPADFLVTATTTLYDHAAKPIGLSQVAAKNKVKIAYNVSPEGVKQATSVKVL